VGRKSQRDVIGGFSGGFVRCCFVRLKTFSVDFLHGFEAEFYEPLGELQVLEGLRKIIFWCCCIL